MFNLAMCDASVSQWLNLKATLSQWLTKPVVIVLPLLFLVLLPWIFPRLRWKRIFSTVGVLLLVIYLSATFPLTIAVAKQGLVAFIPPDSGTTADAIVVLGRGKPFRKSRVEVAAELWKARRAPLIFASGAGDGSEIVQQLKEKGIPNSVLSEEHCSETTRENALLTASELQARGVTKILLVTDPPHMLRSLLTFQSMGFEVTPHTSPVPSGLSSTKTAVLLFSEYVGLVSYGLQGRFLPQNEAAKEIAPPVAKVKNLQTLGNL
ncbi:YdcF family protein [Scytonema sp. UIC 10036]|uniref:YdcF family protein n=1 Tax=Scytonema sp. UIC 10036 TaxID=2304196 RepID=UPI0012DA216A|nr:YdcF family protein [Scytonema sp. UIC 10036]MUG97176.1 YdcF family protein [Scytonema sp. UIC 10036]